MAHWIFATGSGPNLGHRLAREEMLADWISRPFGCYSVLRSMWTRIHEYFTIGPSRGQVSACRIYLSEHRLRLEFHKIWWAYPPPTCSPDICTQTPLYLLSQVSLLRDLIISLVDHGRIFADSKWHRYRGSNGFKRKDHLRQHVRNYHHIGLDEPVQGSPSAYPCDFEGCDKVGPNAFETEKLLKNHLRKDHPSPFQCSHPGCDRVGTNGWFRVRDMVRHVRQKHEAWLPVVAAQCGATVQTFEKNRGWIDVEKIGLFAFDRLFPLAHHSLSLLYSVPCKVIVLFRSSISQ